MDRLKVLPNERVDIEDFRAGTGDLVLADQLRQNGIFVLPTGRTTGLALTSARIVDGFTIASSYIGGTTAVLLRGSGFLPIYEDGETRYGLLLGTEDPASWSLDFSGVADGVYSVWVRAVIGDGAYENRVYWNPLGAPAREIVGNMATRRIQSWEACLQAVAAAPPGHGEWVNVWRVTRAGGVISVLTDYRHLFFEGSAPDTYAEEWGDGANDRNADRKLYGVKDLHMWGQLVRRQLANIIGVKHYTAIPRHLTDLAVQHKAGGAHGVVIADALIADDGGVADTGWQTGTYAEFGLTSGINRGTKRHGHIVRPHEFFDDFFYVGGGAGSAGLLHEQVANMPWGFRAEGGGALGSGTNYAFAQAEPGGVIRLHAENVSQRGLSMISGYNANSATFKGWWNLMSPLAATMFRFKTPADISEWAILLGLVIAGDELAQPAAYVEYIDDSGGGGTGGQLQARVHGGLGATGAAVNLGALVAGTWYTIRMWMKNTTAISFQLNNAAAVDAAPTGGDTVQSGAYDLFARNMTSSAAAGARDLLIDQAFACDGELAADME